MGFRYKKPSFEDELIEMIPQRIGLTLAEFLSLDWEIDYVDGTVVFHGDSPPDLLSKIKGLDNFSVRLPSGLEWRLT